MLALSSPALAQDADALRGTFADNADEDDQQASLAAAGVVVPTQRPIARPTARPGAPESSFDEIPVDLERETAAERRARLRREATAIESEQSTANGAPRDIELDETTTGRVQRVGPVSERAGRIETGAGNAETEPFAAPGIRMGTFLLRPTIEQGLYAETSSDSAGATTSGVASETTLRATLESDWALHAATLGGFVTRRQALGDGETSETQAGVEGTLRLDLTPDTTATLSTSYNLVPQDPSAEIAPGAVNRPDTQTFDGRATLRRDLDAWFVQGSVQALHRAYGAATLEDGSSVSQRDLDNTLLTGRLRAGYALSPTISPFAEVEIGKRIPVVALDRNGYDRTANRHGLRGGAEFDFGEKLRGELAVGYLNETIADSALAPINAVSVDGNVAWSPHRGTTVNLNLATLIETSNLDSESGATLYTGTLGVTHEARSDLTANLAVSATRRVVSGPSASTLTVSGEAGLTWWLNRWIGVTGHLRHEREFTDGTGESSQTTSGFLGIRAQR